MSNIFGPIVDDAAANFAAFYAGGRMIGDIIPDVVIEELHHDHAAITVHPVETGTPVSDHMFLLPKTVEMRPAWSDSSVWGAPGYSRSVYAQLVALQQTREPFELVTGKRSYQNMQIRDLAVKTDVESENGLLAVVIFQEIIIASVTMTSAGSSTNGQSTVAAPGSSSASSAGAAGMQVNSDGSVSFDNEPSIGGLTQSVETDSAPSVAQVAAAGGVP